MNGDRLRDEYMEALLGRIISVRYPSKELMDRAEQLVHKREYAERVLEYLIENVNRSRYPSHQLMDRIERILFDVGGAVDVRPRD